MGSYFVGGALNFILIGVIIASIICSVVMELRQHRITHTPNEETLV